MKFVIKEHEEKVRILKENHEIDEEKIRRTSALLASLELKMNVLTR